MKTLIIPDIHTKFDIAEIFIDKEKPDNVVFLGDYFDTFDDTLEITEQTSLWLKDSLKKKNRIHLLGNHDLSYKDTRFACSGFSEEKLIVLKKVRMDLTKLQHYCWVGDEDGDGWLCTHAGLSKEFYEFYKNKDNYDDESVNDFLARYCSDPKLQLRLYDCGPSRGGQDDYGGIVWCDYFDFVDIPNTKQIFGHTRRAGLIHTENHICLDSGLQNYAVYEDDDGNGKITIKSK